MHAAYSVASHSRGGPGQDQTGGDLLLGGNLMNLTGKGMNLKYSRWLASITKQPMGPAL